MSFDPLCTYCKWFSRDDYKGLSGAINDMGNTQTEHENCQAEKKPLEDQRRFRMLCDRSKHDAEMAK